MTKKYASNDKNQLLVENFKKFMEEGDFSPDLPDLKKEGSNDDLIDEGEYDAAERGKHPLDIFNEMAIEIQDKGGKYAEIHKAAQEHKDPRVGALSAMLGTTLSKKHTADPKEQFQQALRLWFIGDLDASKTMQGATRRDPMEVGWWKSLTTKSPFMMKYFQSEEYQKMMEYYNDFIEYGEKMEKVDQKHDELAPADQKKYKHFQSDWFKRFIEIPSRKREKAKEDAEREYQARQRRKYRTGGDHRGGSGYYSAPGSAHFHGRDKPESYSSTTGRDKTSTPTRGFGFEENKKYSSFEEQQKLTENFRRFVEDEDSKSKED